MTTTKIDLNRRSGSIKRNPFGGFAEHPGRCIDGGIYEPGASRADKDGFHTDVLEIPVMRYPGSDIVSGSRWIDGMGPIKARPELAWQTVEPNRFSISECAQFCCKIDAEPLFSTIRTDFFSKRFYIRSRPTAAHAAVLRSMPFRTMRLSLAVVIVGCRRWTRGRNRWRFTLSTAARKTPLKPRLNLIVACSPALLRRT